MVFCGLKFSFRLLQFFFYVFEKGEATIGCFSASGRILKCFKIIWCRDHDSAWAKRGDGLDPNDTSFVFAMRNSFVSEKQKPSVLLLFFFGFVVTA